jgi:hypothetical protein
MVLFKGELHYCIERNANTSTKLGFLNHVLLKLAVNTLLAHQSVAYLRCYRRYKLWCLNLYFYKHLRRHRLHGELIPVLRLLFQPLVVVQVQLRVDRYPGPVAPYCRHQR